MTRMTYKRIKTTPMAPAGCHTQRHASRDSYYKNMIIWCLAFIASNLLKCLLLSLHIIAVNM